jgi:hypothetical protein
MLEEVSVLDLAILMDRDSSNVPVIETNAGLRLRAPDWPHDCEFQLIAFDPGDQDCDVVGAGRLAKDIRLALAALDKAVGVKGRRPDWYRRLSRCAKCA